MLLGNVYSIEQKWEKAEETLKMAIEYLSPRDREEPTWIYSDLAGVYAKQGLYEKALETMKLASKSKMHNSAVEFKEHPLKTESMQLQFRNGKSKKS